MPLSKAFTAPNGATLTYHRVIKAEASRAGIQILVQSWPDEAAFLDGRQALWNSRINDDSQPDLLATLEAALVQSNGDFGGSTLIPDNGTEVAMARARRWAKMKAQRDLLDFAPIPFGDFSLDADSQSRQDIMGAIMAMQMTNSMTRTWRCADNVMRELSLSELVAIGTAIAARRQQLIETSAALYTQLTEATTVAQVEAVVWPAPQPTTEPTP